LSPTLFNYIHLPSKNLRSNNQTLAFFYDSVLFD
jgi:hypothetical protein